MKRSERASRPAIPVWAVLTVAVAGLSSAWGLAIAFGDSVASATEVVGLAAGAALALTGVGALVISRLRRHRLTVHLWVAASTTVLGLAAGVLIASWQMLVSPADAEAVLVILVAAGTVGILASFAMSAGFSRAVEDVSTLANSIGHRPSREVDVREVPTRELSGLASQLQDIAEQLHESSLRERALESSRRELVTWISHDLRTPLAGIRAVSEALEDGVVDDPEVVRKYHRIMHAEVDRLSGMVDDLFRLSRIHSGLVNLHLEVVALDDLVSDALSLAAPVAAAKGVELSGQVPERGLRVPIATTEFLRVLRNLLDNALRHTPAGGRVSLEAAVRDHQAVLAVRDGCGGIPDGALDRVFDAGYREDLARTPGESQRAGLGLAIAQGLVEAHGGSLMVHNEAGGCCFTVRLPLSLAA